jgi:nitrogen regulatory protein PII
MKLVVAIIGPEKLEAVETALKQRDVSLFCVSQVLGARNEADCTGMYRGTAFHVRRAKLRLEAAVRDELVEAAVDAILRCGAGAESLHPDDVKLVVSPLDACLSAHCVPLESHP